MNSNQILVPMNAARVCDAISRIGYWPWSAVMDIVDNSISAGARNVVIEIDLRAEMTYSQKSSVATYRIVDDGRGMTDGEILNAFALGADANYSPDSLSKFGMGLKSAGFSLGSRIQIVSKKEGVYSSRSYVDKEEISEARNYVVTRLSLDDSEREVYGSWLGEWPSGTVVEVTGCETMPHDSARTIVERLKDRLGVVYYEFLRTGSDSLSITIRWTGKPDIIVEPVDILFSGIARDDFDKDTYDGKSPYRVFDRDVRLSDGDEGAPLRLEVVVFPKGDMAKHPEFSDEERLQIKSYRVSRANKGFFIYRNGRLIRWGDDLDGIVGRDNIGFRARMVINTRHDDVLHVDVSKQRLGIPEEIKKHIETLVRIPLRQAEDAFEYCRSIANSAGSEGFGFNAANQNLAEEDPDQPFGAEPILEAKKRKKSLAQKTEEVMKDEEPETPQPSQVSEVLLFQKVRYSDKVSSMTAWEAELADLDGTFVRINKNHAFYQTVLSRIEDGDRERQAFEAIFWSLAAAENLTVQHVTDVDMQTLKRVVAKFKKVFAANLDTWCSSNQDLFDND